MTDFSKYHEAAKTAFDNFYIGSLRPIPQCADHDHIINIARSVMMHRDGVMLGGSFVTAINENDLDATISRADSVCAQNIPFFVHCKRFINI